VFDVVAKAKTGSGKTFAYLLPLLHDLLKLPSEERIQKSAPNALILVPTREGRIRKSTPNALILVPTRELCQQVVKMTECINVLSFMHWVGEIPTIFI
jgi:superfamily II DNA/RNA helicase